MFLLEPSALLLIPRRGFFLGSTVVHSGSCQIFTVSLEAFTQASGSGGKVSSCFSTASAHVSLFIAVSTTRAAKFICVWTVGAEAVLRSALVHAGLSLPKETPCVIVSVADHKGVHELLVQPIGNLLRVVEQDLLHLPLSHSRHTEWGHSHRSTIGQFLEAALHVDYLCVHRRTELFSARLDLLSALVDAMLMSLVQHPSASDAFFASPPVVLVAKPGGLGGSTRTVAAVMSWLTTRAAAVRVRVLRHVARLCRHLRVGC